MKRLWAVTYYYLATGQEGAADVRYYGEVVAETELEARQKAARAAHPDASEADVAWIVGCLRAR